MQTIHEKIGQMVMVGFHGFTLPVHIRDWLSTGQIGGVILFSRNVKNPQQIADLTRDIRQAAKHPVLIGIDQEGGIVARLRDTFLESPGAMALASARQSEQLTEEMSYLLGYEMHTLGINWNYAPVVDIFHNRENPSLGVRSFGTDPESVAQLAQHAVNGFQKAGVAACAKHFPGLGDTAIDTHLALPRLEKSIEEIRNFDLMPYRSVIESGIASIMTTHTIFTNLDDQYPATLSPVVIKTLLRDELGYDGVITTDCLEMKAIADNYSVEETAVLAVQAGVDILLISHTQETQQRMFDALVTAVEDGRISIDILDKANERIQRLKASFPSEPEFHPDAILSPEHVEKVESITKQTITLVKSNPTIFPLNQLENVVVVEFASYMDSEVIEIGGQTGLKEIFERLAPEILHIGLKSYDASKLAIGKAQETVDASDVLILATRSAHLNDQQLEIAEDLVKRAKHTILLGLRNPFDAHVLSDAETILVTCGDSKPSLEAVVKAVLGEFTPTGQLPVALVP